MGKVDSSNPGAAELPLFGGGLDQAQLLVNGTDVGVQRGRSDDRRLFDRIRA